MDQAFPSAVLPYLPWLIVHIAGGSIAILTGYVAITVKKGERLHRIFGTLFLLAMLTMATAAVYLAINLIGALPRQVPNIAAGFLVPYLVLTGWMAIRRKEGTTGLFERVALVVAIAGCGTFLFWGYKAVISPAHGFDGYGPPLFFVFAGLLALFAAWDVKVLIKGGVAGRQRIARHLWRMSFAFFVAAGSFFLGQQKIMPAWMHGAWYLYVLGLTPLALMFFWLVRVRFTNWWRDHPPAPDQATPREEVTHA